MNDKDLDRAEIRHRWFLSTVDDMRKTDRARADAMSAIYDYITDKWSGAYPPKEQTDSVNEYFRSAYCDWKDDAVGNRREQMIAHREIAAKRLVIDLINFLDREKLDSAEQTLLAIARDPGYHMPEKRGYGR